MTDGLSAFSLQAGQSKRSGREVLWPSGQPETQRKYRHGRHKLTNHRIFLMDTATHRLGGSPLSNDSLRIITVRLSVCLCLSLSLTLTHSHTHTHTHTYIYTYTHTPGMFSSQQCRGLEFGPESCGPMFSRLPQVCLCSVHLQLQRRGQG